MTLNSDQQAVAELIAEGLAHQVQEHGEHAVLLASSTLCPQSCVVLCGTEMLVRLQALYAQQTGQMN